VRLLEADDDLGAMLLDRCETGTALRERVGHRGRHAVRPAPIHGRYSSIVVSSLDKLCRAAQNSRSHNKGQHCNVATRHACSI
jgi:hypothetical protein